MKTAEQYVDEALKRAVPLPADQLALRRDDGELLRRVAADAAARALADAGALPGAMAPPDVDGARRWARGALSPEGKARVLTLCDWSDYLAGWVHDLLLDRGAYDARREGEAAGLRRAAGEAESEASRSAAVGTRFPTWHSFATHLLALAGSLRASPPPPPARMAADLAACRAALAELLRVLETEEGDDPMAINRALAEAHLALRGQPT